MTGAEIMELTSRYVMQTYGRLPLALVRGQGARVWDAEGKEYLDFVAGLAVCSLGHCHPAVVEAITSQVRKLMHVSNLYYIETQARLARLLVENSCGDRVFFCNSGAEANEAAIKLARKYGKIHGGQEKYEIITALKSFHGRTLAAITATAQSKYQKGFEPLPAGFKYVPFNDVEALSRAVNPGTCAVLLEPVQGEGGVNVATPEFLKAARELCDRYNALLIFDEVQCGLGRTGRFLAYQHYGVEPDIFTLAKALGGGFPIGAMVAKEKVAAAFSPGDHASTFGGNPLACAAGLAAVKCLLNEGVIENAARVGAYLKDRLLELAGRFSFVREVRGLGLMLGMELSIEGKEIVGRCQERGLLINCVDNHILRFIPPLIIGEAEVDEAVEILAGVLAEMKQ
ncbi:acetylornithine aminotransferase [Desulfofundulus australicus DSM 11792]|uniref:Acetylornithine aminotransferase n=1 Tax=Desulfofundulus australicus DSM 11792 TaxID=1121425 RepID=A0A1M4X5U7_9FIRM|nr:acetylornithine transaminase [Desulfofundulus australicus]SHE88894.1 acetylornithine aminotransferase [Desulfofundulus australicus DSM 11792]